MIPISFEFFPPKTDEQKATLEAALPKLKALSPEYVSVTFGAGGSTLSYTPETVRHLRAEHALDAAPHLSCMGGTRKEILSLLGQYKTMGCRRIVALRGDLPSGMASYGDFRYASELVEFIRKECNGDFHIEVACYPEMHPQAGDARSDLKNFISKVNAGADGAITQYFYNPDAYFRFVDDARKHGVAVPIVPGIMPITQYSQLRRFSDMC
ncbi:MAG: methylenetetrahydrofolate reductase, partial [Rudaea sp.]